MAARTLKALLLVVASLLLAGCGRIGSYSNYEIADEIARQQGPKKAEEWLAEVAGPEESKLWRERYGRAMKKERQVPLREEQ